MLYGSASRQVDCKWCRRDLLSLITGHGESKKEERRCTCGKTICRLKANVRQGSLVRELLRESTLRAMFEFAAQLAPGLLMAGRNHSSTLLPRSPPVEARRMVRLPEKRE